ncbi:MAG: pyridoxal-phosphate dependent enzyme [Shewanella sp.]|nr:pyridoxal-phosphate dependent enzyme [Shewanella sp.]MCF1431712.1 pyridoxal-phosphate dependent enzyme [Shewanella sp.]MCF1439486.1 pyridoxal-phosphate dependent enzyme [Shewanella sp.]MCF1459200.1 pyridoxal-phosphate dependent enzyme [Shewanella sp.]
MLLINSPIEQHELFGFPVFIKRDDLLHQAVGGNKARKFAALLEMDFSEIDTLIGYGSAQANSLYTMAAFAQLKGCQLEFYVDHISDWLTAHPCGNYRGALQLGARVIPVARQADRGELSVAGYIEQRVLPARKRAMFVPEGGRFALAARGVEQLAKELADWRSTVGSPNVKVILPAGTGTTALFLSRYFYRNHLDLKVITVPAVGGIEYLRSQFTELEANLACHPQIIDLGRKYHFGKLYRDFVEIWQQTRGRDVEFELLYDPLGLMALRQIQREDPSACLVYIHQGGILGNETMLARYQRKYPELCLS